MKWFRKYIGNRDYSADLTVFKTFYDDLRSPAGMMMLVGSNRDFDYTVYVHIPEGLTGTFAEYEASGAPEEEQVMGLCGAPRDLLEHLKMKR
jgi:hypothetical protein